MGKPANPGVPYCTGGTQGILSVNGQFVKTTNPPISYSANSSTLTVSDAAGILETIDLSDDLVLTSSNDAAPGTPYCGGSAKSVLTWNGGSVETRSPPIEYSLNCSPPTDVFVANFLFNDDSGNNCNSIFPPTIFNPQLWAESGISNTLGQQVIPDDYYISFYRVGSSRIAVAGDIINISRFHCQGNYFMQWTLNGSNVSLTGGGQLYKSQVETCNLVVSDSTGVIFEEQYDPESPPENFAVECFAAPVPEVSYACESECPGGTEFECRCETENTLTCYAFNADRSRFEPILETFLVD